MSYQVLARKWRPHRFEEMVGQEHVLRMLTNALDNQRLHHAYLLTGTRGVGKTTLARLLAKCLNCETGITSQPCGTCSTCLAIDAGRFLDLLEIDAASRTKVEDTRDLLENVQYAPSQGRYKVYLIDEVHMLSGHSFNALLKTLEEPPAHVKFILATTDPKRLPITILSRCLQFNLKRVPIAQITQQLEHICKAENVQFELPALTQVAEAADGSMRDALSLLDQAIAFCGDHIIAEDVRRLLGNVEQDYIFRLLNALADQDGKRLLAEISTLSEQAPDFIHVLGTLLSSLHQCAILQTIPGSLEAHEALIQLAQRLSPEDVQLYYQIALIGRRDLPLTPDLKQGFEMILLRMLAFKPATIGNSKKTAVVTSTTTQQAIATPTKKISTTDHKIAVSDEWAELLAQLNLSGMTYALASNCALVKITDNTIELALSKNHEPMLNKKLVEKMEEALSSHYKKSMQVQIKLSTAPLNTSAKQQAEVNQAKLETAVAAITQDSQVQRMMDVFGATLDVDSVKAID